MVGFIFGGEGLPKTPQELARLRAVAQAMAPQKTPQNVGEGLSSIGNAIAYRMMMAKADKGDAMGQNTASNAFSALMGGMGGGTPPASSSVSNATPAPSMAATPSNQPPIPGIQAQQSGSTLPNSFLAAVDRTEGAGGYDTLYGHAQKNAFAGTDVSKMPIADVLAFTDPSGAYAQSVKGQIGRVATPVGRYQVVGTTLRKAVDALGLDPSQPFDAATQDRVAGYLATQRVKSAGSMPEKIGALRSEWHGFKDVPDSEMAQIVADLESGGGGMSALAAQPGMAATANIPMGGAAQEISGNVPGYVDPMVSAPNSRKPVAQALAQVQQPVQTAQAGNGRQGIMAALMGGQQRTQDMPTDYFPAAPSAPGATSPSRQQIMQVLTNQFATPEQKAIAQAEYERMQQASDPLRQLQLEKGRAELDALKAKPSKNWQKLDDQTLYSPDTGETKDVSGTAAGGTKAFRFGGTSVEAQALNGLMDSGQISPEQAQQLGAGKTITGPNGEIIFMTPQGVFGQPSGGGAPQPMQPSEPSIFPTGPSQTAAPASSTPGPRTNIPITEPKVTLDEKKAMTFADRLVTSGDLIDQFGKVGTDKTEVMKSQIPFGLGNMLVGEEFQKFDQARRDFINAQLRRESGAVISDEEFDNANKQYFPQPGDGPDVLKQKAANRRVAIEGMVRDGGPTYKRPQSQKPAIDLSKPVSEMTDEELEALANGD